MISGTAMKLPFFLLLGWVLYTALPASAAGPDLNELIAAPAAAPPSPPAPSRSLFQEFNEFNSRIRDGRIRKAAARAELPVRLAAVREEYRRRGGKAYPETEWIFPVAGYSAAAIDKGKGHGFAPRGYDYFSGNRHGGHPAYDIFIHDRNQNCRDDRTGAAVHVLSMTGGVVVAVETGWQQGSGLRGGNYIWVYDPANQLLVYYAHNETVLVEPGTIVKPGDPLATIGRSGLNAAKRRSPTHLHFTVLGLEKSKSTPLPVAVYPALKQAKSLVYR